MKITLNEIIRHKKKEVAEKKKKSGRNFLERIVKPQIGDIGIIAEIKLASPTEEVLGHEKDVCSRAVIYGKAGADAISIVVDYKYFGGNLNFIREVKKTVSLPVLMKDFIIDPFQIYEAKMNGADAVLLIAKILTATLLINLVKLTESLGMIPIVEINNKDDRKKALKTRALCIAVNSRDLSTFQVDVDRACQLIKSIPSTRIVLGFSGVKGREEVEKYQQAGAKAVLVGTSLMKVKNINQLIKNLKGL